MCVAGTCVRGIIVVTAPTLAPAADVFKKFKVADESTGFVDAIHFDEDIGTDDTKRLLITDLRNIKRIFEFSDIDKDGNGYIWLHSDCA
jgi:hypothetical protein